MQRLDADRQRLALMDHHSLAERHRFAYGNCMTSIPADNQVVQVCKVLQDGYAVCPGFYVSRVVDPAERFAPDVLRVSEQQRTVLQSGRNRKPNLEYAVIGIT